MHRLTKFTLLAGLILFTTNPASAQTPTPPPGPTYIVQAGDTLSSIAARFNVLIDELMVTNNITDPNLISAGQYLIIPGLEGVNGILLTEVVQYGDSFRSLSRRNQVPEALLRKLNHLVSPTELYAGVSLIVPQQEGKPALSTRSSLETGETLLELAVQQNTDPWTIIHTNSLDATWAALPGDVLYTLSGNTPQFISGLPSVFASAEVSPLPIVQGGTAEIRVKLSQPATLTGLLVDKPLFFSRMSTMILWLYKVFMPCSIQAFTL
jgi:LysM repeat protein